jgi:predicted glutamine amidotransferase
MSTMITEPEHAMLQLAMKAQCCTPVNADGFGICWYLPDVPVPGLFKDITPAWNNNNLKTVARAIKSPCFFAHVRAASAGGVTYPNCHPFVYRNISFMHNGTVPYFKQIKRAMLAHISDKALQFVQGTTDSEMMFAMFITNFEKLAQMDKRAARLDLENSGEHHNSTHDASDTPFEYTLFKEDYTHYLVASLRATLRQVHYLTLDHEYKTGVQPRPASGHEPLDADQDGASHAPPLPETVAIGRLNLAVSDGQSTCTSRYASSAPETAHTLYYSTGSRYECVDHQCQVLETPPASPRLVSASPRQTPSPIQSLTSSMQSLTSPLRQVPKPINSKVVVVSSEPLAHGFNCDVVPVNHMVVSGPNGFFEVLSCL